MKPIFARVASDISGLFTKGGSIASISPVHSLRLIVTLLGLQVVVLFSLMPQPATASGQLQGISVTEEGAMVYDENSNGQPDLFGDTWVYDTDDNGRAELILRFRQEPALVAYIYDDTDANSQVDFALSGSTVQILEPFWRGKVTNHSSAWRSASGIADWNADFEIDSGYSFYGVDADYILVDPEFESPDGNTNLLIRYWDMNQDGIPDFELNTVNQFGVTDFFLVNRDMTLRPESKHLFPWLETVLEMDWERSRLAFVRHLIPSRTGEAGYFFMFNTPITPGQVVHAMEDPFAFYDLQGDQDGYAELRLRTVVEDYDSTRPNLIGYNEVRYSWSQTDDEVRYRIFLIGQVFSEQTHAYPMYTISHKGYESLPGFVLGSAWKGAAFAEYEAAESIAFGEGIYENLFYTPNLREVVISRRLIELPAYLPVNLYLREEFNFTDYNRSPRLYFSPIDQRLHLFGALQGMIIFSADTSNPVPGFDFSEEALKTGNLNIYASTLYTDTDRDGFVDTWMYLENQQLVQMLVFRKGAALLFSGSTLVVKNLPLSMAAIAWEAQPPATPEDWRFYQQKLESANGQRHDLNRLDSIFAELPGETLSLSNCLLLNVSTNSQELLAEITTTGLNSSSQPAPFTFFSQAIPAGNYLLRASSGRFWLEGSSPAQVELSPLVFLPGSQEIQGGNIIFKANNAGTKDASVEFTLTEYIAGGYVTLYHAVITVPALGQVDFNIPWVPGVSGSRRLVALLEYTPSPGLALQRSQQALDLYAVFPGSISETLYLSMPYTGALITLIIALVSLLVAGVWRFVREGGKQ